MFRVGPDLPAESVCQSNEQNAGRIGKNKIGRKYKIIQHEKKRLITVPIKSVGDTQVTDNKMVKMK